MRTHYLVTAVLLALAVTTRTDAAPRCEEDEAILWTETAHDQCVPLDDITEAAIDLYIEANMQVARR